MSGDKDTVTAVSAAHGTVVLSSTGAITYTAPASGTDTLTFTVTDQLGDTATGSYGLTVSPASIAGTASHFGGATDPSWGAADAGVTVRLLNAAGTVVATAVTSANGYFAFPYNVAGTYQLQYVAPTGQAIQSTSKTVNPLTGLSALFTVAANQQYVAAAAPMVSVGTLAGQVLTAQSGAGQCAMTVNLLNASGTVTATTTTDSSGKFAFGHLSAASYQVQYRAPTGQVLQAGGPANAATGMTGQYAVALGQTVTLATETVTQPYASITGSVLLGNTLGEAGVSVSLLNAAGSAVQTTTTSTAGGYSFTGMASGTYSVKIAAPTGQVFQTGSAANVGTGIISGITATLGQATSVASENLLSSPGVIQGSVHHYGSADPVWGTGQYGTSVSLLNAAGTVIATTVTSSSGWFSFGKLGAGSYQLQYTPTADEAMKAGNGVAASGLSTPVTLTSGQNVFLPIAALTSVSNSFALTGSGAVALRGAGNYSVTGNGTGSTLTLGAGNSTVALTGTGNTITVGAGTESITLGGANNVVHAAGGNVTITAGGANNLFDGGKGISFLNTDGSAGNKFVLGASGQGLATITGFNPATTDVLDLARTLAGVSILANLSNVGSYLTAVTNGGNTSLYADLTGGHSTAGGAIATLTGVSTSVASLLSGHHLSMS